MTDAEAQYTHGHAESVLRSHRWRTAANSAAHLLGHLKPGLSLLDVGAGPGTITAELAALIHPGRLTALEVSPEAAAITEAGLGATSNTNVVVGDVHHLHFDDDSFDVVHAHQVLQHVTDPIVAIGEMLRVTKVGGIVALRDSDYGGFIWAPADPFLDRWLELYQQAARANGGEPNAGRYLLGWAHAAGAPQVAPSSSTWCFATPEDRAYWGEMWADRILTSKIATQLLAGGWSTGEELEEISRAWQRWSEQPSGWISLLHAEVIITKTPDGPTLVS